MLQNKKQDLDQSLARGQSLLSELLDVSATLSSDWAVKWKTRLMFPMQIKHGAWTTPGMLYIPSVSDPLVDPRGDSAEFSTNLAFN